MSVSNMKTIATRAGLLATVALGAALLAACNDKAAPAAAAAAAGKGGDVVAAKVNGDEITVREIDAALAQQHLRPEQMAGARKQLLDRLIDEQIVVQRALVAKLDKDEKVQLQLDNARKAILARRYVETLTEAASGAGAGGDAVQKFYDSKPATFAQNKTFTLQRTEVQAPPDRRAEVTTRAEKAKALAELTDWLKAQKIPFNTTPLTQNTEQLPPPVVDKLGALKDGESSAQPSPAGVTVLTRVSAKDTPKSLDEARPMIEQYLASQGRREIVTNLQKTIRDGAKIEYEGPFAASAPAAGASSVVFKPAVPASAGAASAAHP